MTREEIPYEALERIAEAHWNRQNADGVIITDTYQHNACNHTVTGTVDIDGQVFGFVIEMGDWNGTVVNQWGDPDDIVAYEPPKIEPLTFLPEDPHLLRKRPDMFKVYAIWRKEEWFKEKERAYNYDRHFQPGIAIEKHYREWAGTRGLRIGYLSHLTEEELTIINEIF